MMQWHPWYPQQPVLVTGLVVPAHDHDALPVRAIIRHDSTGCVEWIPEEIHDQVMRLVDQALEQRRVLRARWFAEQEKHP